MAHVKILDSVWFNGPFGTIGIVMTDNGFEKKAYLGLAVGFSESLDAKRIAVTGAPVHAGALRSILRHLEDQPKENHGT